MSSQSRVEDIAQRPWHALSPQDALQAVKSQEQGLEQEEVKPRRDRFGPNTLPKTKRAGLFKVFLRQLKKAP